MLRYLKYEKLCLLWAISKTWECLKKHWFIEIVIPITTGAVSFMIQPEQDLDALILAVMSGIIAAIVSVCLIFIWYVFSAAYNLWIEEKERFEKGRTIVGKITDGDLQRMLHGYIYENTFLYEADALGPLKTFKGPYDFEKLRARYNLTKINCPANCTVYLDINLINGTEFIGKPLSFWVKDGMGQEHEFDYNDTLESIGFKLGQDSSVYIKLEYPSDVVIDEYTCLQIKMDSWKI